MLKSTSEYNQETSLLILDDDSELLKRLKKLFSNIYDVKIVMSSKEAYTTIKLGFIPGVIISDQDMPNVLGSKFLEDTSKILPDSSRILMTGHNDSKDIAKYISDAKAFMFLFKPFTDLEIIQTIKISFERFKNIKATNQLKKSYVNLQTQFKTQTEKIKLLEIGNFKSEQDYLETFALISDKLESSYYFTSKTNYVWGISNSLCDNLSIRSDMKLNISNISMMIHSLYMDLPLRLKLTNYFDLTNENDIENYLSYLGVAIKKMEQIAKLNKYVNILKQVFENYDGTGMPNGLSKMNIYKEAQVLSISNLYHNLVYRISYEDFQELVKKGEFQQSPETTLLRHNKAIKFIKNRSDWFSYDIVNSFFDIIEKNKSEFLIPNKLTLITKY